MAGARAHDQHATARSVSNWLRSLPWWVPAGAAVLAYIVIALLAYWPVEPLSGTQVVGCACSDPAQEIWFLAWPAYALRHGVNPLFTGYLNYPYGINLASNTSMPLLGLLGAPLTWLRGPIATYNALLRFSFVASATSMLYVVRRFTRWWPAAFFAGLLYGFSPYMVGQGHGHLFLTFVPMPPLIALYAYRLLSQPRAATLADTPANSPAQPLERRATVRTGLVLGSLCLVQFFISIEVLATTIVSIAVVAVVAGLIRPRQALRHLRAAAAGLAAAAAVFVPLAAYPIWFLLQGPQHIVGPSHSVANLAPIKADLLGSIVPTKSQLFGSRHLRTIGTMYSAKDLPENGAYLGVALIAVLLYLVIRYRREEVVRLGAGIGLTGLVLSLGTPLVIDNHRTGVPLPFAVLVHLPLIQGIAALRLTLYEQLGAALVLGVGLDRMRSRSPATDAGEDRQLGRHGGWPSGLAAGAVGVVALLPLVPHYPYRSKPAAIPPYFFSDANRAIAPGSVVLTYPYDVDPANQAMVWQAVGGMRFRIFGGQASRPGRDGRATSDVAELMPAAVQQLFTDARFGGTRAAEFALGPKTLGAVRTFLVRYQVGTVAIEPFGLDPSLAVRGITRALGRPPRREGGVDLWYNADRTAAHLLGDTGARS